MQLPVRTIAIVGGGSSGSVLAANRLRRATAAAELRVHAEQLATALMNNERRDAATLRRTAP